MMNNNLILHTEFILLIRSPLIVWCQYSFFLVILSFVSVFIGFNSEISFRKNVIFRVGFWIVEVCDAVGLICSPKKQPEVDLLDESKR